MSFNRQDFLHWAQNQQSAGGPGFDNRNSRERLENQTPQKKQQNNTNNTSDRINDVPDNEK